jgi:D-arginine dehydrogenase
MLSLSALELQGQALPLKSAAHSLLCCSKLRMHRVIIQRGVLLHFGFADVPLLHRRGALHLGTKDDEAAAQAMAVDFERSGVRLDRLHQSGIADHVQGLRDGWNVALWEPDCCDIDVAALHAGYLKQASANGVQLQCRASLHNASYSNGCWQLATGAGAFTCKILVNAAGAWADSVAESAGINPIGITL